MGVRTRILMSEACQCPREYPQREVVRIKKLSTLLDAICWLRTRSSLGLDRDLELDESPLTEAEISGVYLSMQGHKRM
jgi:hypothetical protein